MIENRRPIHDSFIKKKDIFLQLTDRLFLSFDYGPVYHLQNELYFSIFEKGISPFEDLRVIDSLRFDISSLKTDRINVNENVLFSIESLKTDNVLVSESIQISMAYFTNLQDMVTISENVKITLENLKEINGSTINEVPI